MSSVTIEPPGGLSCGVPTKVRMASATGQVPGLAVRYVPHVRYVRYTPLALGLSAF